MHDSRLPPSLLSSETYRALSDEQRASVERRIQSVSDLSREAAQWFSAPMEDREWASFLEDLELDVTAALYSGFGDPNTMSVWLLHTTWSFDMSGHVENDLAPNVLRRLDSALLSRTASIADLRDWLSEEIGVVQDALSGLTVSRSLSCAVAHLIAIDGLLARLLAVLCIRRLG